MDKLPRSFRNRSFTAAELLRMIDAYDAVMRTLGLGTDSEVISDLVAHKIVEASERGEHDVRRLSTQVLAHFGVYRKDD
jgi:hypothetical protein